MSNNKQILAQNNTSFRNDLLSAIKNLPMAGGGGVTDIDYGVVTANNTANLTVNHNLGVAPEMVILVAINRTSNTGSMMFVLESSKVLVPFGSMVGNLYGWYGYSSTLSAISDAGSGTLSTSYATKTASNIEFKNNGAFYNFNGEYMWIAIAPNSGHSS